MPKYSNSDKIVNLVMEFLLYEFTEENIENFKKLDGANLRRFSKLNEIDFVANGFCEKKVCFDDDQDKKELEDINETIQEMNLTDQLLLSSEKHLQIGKANLLEAEVSNFNSSKGNNKTKKRIKAKNQGDSTLLIEMKNFELNDTEKSDFGEKLSGTARIENVHNIEEEIVIKEQKGPVLFKIDNYELEYIRVWRTIKLFILSICVLAGFLFYVSLPLIVSFSDMN